MESPHPSRPIRFFYVEDDDGDYVLFKRIFQRNFPDHVLHRGNELSQINEYLKTNGVDILLLDYWVNSTSAEEVIDEIINTHPGLQVVLVSGQQDIHTALNFYRRGIPYIVKGENMEKEAVDVLSPMIQKIRTRLAIGSSELFNPASYPIALVSMDVYPKIHFFIYEDFPYRNGGTEKDFLLKLSIFTMTGVGQGDSYAEGLYKLPVFDYKDTELLVYSFRKKNREHNDPRFAEGYVQLLIFIPSTVIPLISDFVELESVISAQLEHIDDIADIAESDILKIREEVIFHLYREHIAMNAL